VRDTGAGGSSHWDVKDKESIAAGQYDLVDLRGGRRCNKGESLEIRLSLSLAQRKSGEELGEKAFH